MAQPKQQVSRTGPRRKRAAMVMMACAIVASHPVFGDHPCEPGTGAMIGQPGMNQTVRTMTVFDDGTGPALYAGGWFTSAGGVDASYVAKWDGSDWSAPSEPFPGHPLLLVSLFAPVTTMATFDDGTGPGLYVGGYFNVGTQILGLLEWKNGTWSGVGRPAGTNAGVLTLAVFDDGTSPALYAGGSFSEAGDVSAQHIAKWDGNSWFALGSGTDNMVRALAVLDDGTGKALYAGGDFLTAGGKTVNHIAKWDGNDWSPLGAGTEDWLPEDVPADSVWITALAWFDDGTGASLYAAAKWFTGPGGILGFALGKWNGKSWSLIDDSVVLVNTLSVLDKGTGATLYAGGGGPIGAHPLDVYICLGAGPSLFTYLAMWDGAAWAPIDDGLESEPSPGCPAGLLPGIHALTVFDDGTGPALYAAGYFNIVAGVPTNHIVRWDEHFCITNNVCEGATPIADGAIEFDTSFNTTTTGPDEPEYCDFFDDTNVHFDLWYNHVASCTGDLTISTCESELYTKVAVYAKQCPSGSGEAIACNAGACFPQAEITLPVTEGQTLLIRVGGHQGANGPGILEITCSATPDILGDLTGDGSVGVDDLLILIAAWGECRDCGDCPADLNNDCIVGVDDLLILLANWG